VNAGLRAASEQLQARAALLQGLQWPSLDCHNIVAPSGLQFAADAADNVAQNASGLRSHQSVGENEGTRLAESLTSVANAYDEVDRQGGAAIESVDAGGAAPQGPVVPAPPATPPLPAPPPIDSHKPLDGGGMAPSRRPKRS
jgi:hypothetical protein